MIHLHLGIILTTY